MSDAANAPLPPVAAMRWLGVTAILMAAMLPPVATASEGSQEPVSEDVGGETAAVASAGATSTSEPKPLEFEEDEFQDVREGYLTLRWSRADRAVAYRVIDENGRIVYQGAAAEAFISGLEDGTHSFHIQALGPSGGVLASSEGVAKVHVAHWPIRYALVLFVIGLVVISSIVAVIIRGAAAPSPPHTSPPHTSAPDTSVSDTSAAGSVGHES